MCESVPKSCCFGSGPATYAFAGMVSSSFTIENHVVYIHSAYE